MARRQLVRWTFCYTAMRKAGWPDEGDTTGRLSPAAIVAVPDASVDRQRTALAVVRGRVHWQALEVFVLPERGRPLLGPFLALAPTIVLQDEAGSPPVGALDDLIRILQDGGVEAALCCRIATADLAERLASHGVRVVTAINARLSESPEVTSQRPCPRPLGMKQYAHR
jgi:hypothetical protein